VRGLKSSAPLDVVGDLIGSGEAQERRIVGETPNLTACLQGIAEPNTVVIAESTRKLLGNLFDLEDLGAQHLKGIGEPVRVWTALRPSSMESCFEALRASGLTEPAGREEELELPLRHTCGGNIRQVARRWAAMEWRSSFIRRNAREQVCADRSLILDRLNASQASVYFRHT
jgi:hypothetical protein